MVLGHPAVKAFVSHGGQGGIGEAALNMVPLLVVPFFVSHPLPVR
jgi:UDP:flavonoid glycosyltransferase YjiC (YdhE family)